MIKERRHLLRGRPHPLICQTRQVFVPFARNCPHGRFEVAGVLPVPIQPGINVLFSVSYARFIRNRPSILDLLSIDPCLVGGEHFISPGEGRHWEKVEVNN